VRADPLGFVPVDGTFRATGLDDVYAIGDLAAGTVKQGGVAAQTAEVAARAIAARAGAPVAVAPYEPVLRGLLLTGGQPRFLRHDTAGRSEVADEPLWWPADKIAARHLGSYLATQPAFAAVA
jgi:sulfide:quinone oxidoreductase